MNVQRHAAENRVRDALGVEPRRERPERPMHGPAPSEEGLGLAQNRVDVALLAHETILDPETHGFPAQYAAVTLRTRRLLLWFAARRARPSRPRASSPRAAPPRLSGPPRREAWVRGLLALPATGRPPAAAAPRRHVPHRRARRLPDARRGRRGGRRRLPRARRGGAAEGGPRRHASRTSRSMARRPGIFLERWRRRRCGDGSRREPRSSSRSAATT